MFHVKRDHIKRLAFATNLFPKSRSSIGLDTAKLRSTDQFDGELFCGGRSKNRDLLTLFGFIADSNGSSTFIQLPLLRRSVRKLTNLVEVELESIGAQEVLMPTIIPQKLWSKSKRLDRQKDALKGIYKFTDDHDNEVLLGPTFEESVTKLVGDTSQVSEHELPILLYQSSSKFRFEPNPRFGLLRSNEFLMNDMYSFDASLNKAIETYENVSSIYDKIFKRLNLDCLRIEGATGSIGGKYSHEYQLPVSSGEDTIIRCLSCHHACSLDVYKDSQGTKSANDCDRCLKCDGLDVQRTQALELGHTFLLSDTYSKPLSAQFYSSELKAKLNYEMGCYGLGLSRILGAGIDLLSIMPNQDEGDNFLQIRWPLNVEPFKLSIVAPAKRSQQYANGSTEFIERLANRALESTKSIDILVEDRDKEGISRRLIRMKELGIPNIVVVGQRFLNQPREFELLRLNSDSKLYDQLWLTEDQLLGFILELDSESSTC